MDRSIDGPAEFIRTNVVGTQVLLEAAREHWSVAGRPRRKAAFRFHHVSTDEVFGSLESRDDPPFDEHTPYDPRSPYSASKAASDHLVRAWQHTYGLPTFVSNTTNNYGPWQFPEKLIPLVTLNALEGRPLPVYGDGSNMRDWIHVEDHAEALVLRAVRAASPGATYCLGPRQERTNLEVVRAICADARPAAPRPGRPARAPDHLRAATARAMISATRWTPRAPRRRWAGRRSTISRAGLEQTIAWYLDQRGLVGPDPREALCRPAARRQARPPRRRDRAHPGARRDRANQARRAQARAQAKPRSGRPALRA